MKVQRKENGYEKYASAELLARLGEWEKAVENAFGVAVDRIDEFFYGERLVMTTIVLKNRHYGNFNLTARRISFCGHECTTEEYNTFGRLTLNDELYVGGLVG